MMRAHLTRVRAALSQLAGLLRRSERDERLADEIRFHLDMATEQHIARGLPPDAARRAAAIEFGGREQWREAARDEFRSRHAEELMQDVRFALRTLRSAPAFTIAAVLTLAIGIGGNTAIFSTVDGVLLKPLPFSAPERVVSVFQFNRVKRERDDVSPANFADWRARSTAFAGIAAAEPFGYVITGTEGEEQVGTWNVTQDFFSVLDAQPVVGRLFQAQDFSGTAQPVVVLTYASWQKRFGADPTIVGRVITLSHHPMTIVGVLPRSFSYLENSHYEIYTPKVLDASELLLRGADFYHAVARLRPGVSLDQAAADINRVQAQLAVDYPKDDGDVDVALVGLRDSIVGDAGHALLLMLGAVSLVLLIACSNVANLMLARMTRRSREFAIRTALGAGSWRIARQVLTESVLIAIAGGAAGVALAYWGIGVIRALSPASLPRIEEMHVDLRAMGFALAAVAFTALVFGLVPAMRASQPASQDELKGGSRATDGGRAHRLRGLLVTTEVALAVVLLVSAGLLVRSFLSVIQGDRGYRPERVLAATVFAWQWNPTPAARAQFVARLVERAATLPGVTAAGATSSLPLGGSIGADHSSITIVDHPVGAGQEPTEHVTSLTPGTFDALGMRTVRGRLFDSHDDATGPRVAIINESMARRYWPNENAIGKRIAVGFYAAPIEREIVGLVADIRQTALDAPPDPIVYLPHAQAPTGAVSLVVRSSIEPVALTRDVKRMVSELNPELPVAGIETLDGIIAESLKPRRFTLLLFACFSVAALVLAAVGVYGVMANSAAERVREFGVRIALGAQASDIVLLVLRQGVVSAGLGVVLGLAGSFAVTRLLSRMLFAVSPSDALTLGAVSAVMLGTALIACYIPARRATRVDPLMALRA